MAGAAGASAAAAAARGLYRQLLRARRRLPGTQVRSQLKYATSAAFRARRPLYVATRAAHGPFAAAEAASAWMREGERELLIWTSLAAQSEPVRRNLVKSKFDLPM